MTYQHRCGAVAVTATTGIAASLLPGVTLHSWAGISNGKDAQSKLIKQIQRNPNALFRWESAMVLVIDEGFYFFFRYRG
jgi:ATP-dependent DNA helicase PIF1